MCVCGHRQRQSVTARQRRTLCVCVCVCLCVCVSVCVCWGHSNLNKMKMQGNIQQIKEHDKSPSNQTKEEEEIGSLPEKKFRIMIVKMIQNLENKMELKITSPETRIEKM